jgi:DNA modification methylase
LTYELWRGDCRACLANMADDSVDSVVCDPPYELGFMGKTWDASGIAYDVDLWRDVLRVLKPGGHLLAFGGSRTYHRLAVAIEDAGFEIRDALMWLYGSGFPKSHDISKAIDKAAGAERERIGTKRTGNRAARGGAELVGSSPIEALKHVAITAPATPEAQQWSGWGTALKPAHEPIVMARKPVIGTVAANVLAHGVGGLNIDACRAPTEETITATRNIALGSSSGGVYSPATVPGVYEQQPGGRFPANVLHDGSDDVLAIFPAQAGAAAPVRGTEPSDQVADIYNARDRVPGAFHGDAGSAARFFYCAKASKADRDEGCAALAAVHRSNGNKWTDTDYRVAKGERPASAESGPRKNTHPTVKPNALMRWLCRLVTPPGGLVFDPFTGSGSTGKAAILEGFRFLGAELTPEYWPIATARLDHAVNERHTTRP